MAFCGEHELTMTSKAQLPVKRLWKRQADAWRHAVRCSSLRRRVPGTARGNHSRRAPHPTSGQASILVQRMQPKSSCTRPPISRLLWSSPAFCSQNGNNSYPSQFPKRIFCKQQTETANWEKVHLNGWWKWSELVVQPRPWQPQGPVGMHTIRCLGQLVSQTVSWVGTVGETGGVIGGKRM